MTMKSVISKLLVVLMAGISLCIVAVMSFLVVGDLSGSIMPMQVQIESGWGRFFAVLLVPVLIVSLLLLKLSWMFFRHIHPVPKRR